MCGIAGYSLSDASRVDRTLAAQALLAGIAERGGGRRRVRLAVRRPGGRGAEAALGRIGLLERLERPQQATQALIHVRDYTKGHPSVEANNHPVRHGSVVGIHNGIIANDDELFAAEGIERDDAAMSVDSEVIFALAERDYGSPQVFERLVGSMAAAWMDERRPGVLFLARGVGRPLWTGPRGTRRSSPPRGTRSRSSRTRYG